MKKEKEIVNANFEAWRKIRGDWGAISPVTKIVPNKKKNLKDKHKKRTIEQEEEN